LIEYDDDLNPHIQSYDLMQRIAVSKAILISDDPNKCTNFILMIMLNGHHRLAIWRPGDKNWIIFKEEHFFALLVNHEFATIEISPEPKLVIQRTCLQAGRIQGRRQPASGHPHDSLKNKGRMIKK
jgi:hypothetical protein